MTRHAMTAQSQLRSSLNARPRPGGGGRLQLFALQATMELGEGIAEALGTDAIMTLEVHNPAAFENAFRCPAVALTAVPLFVDYANAMGRERLCVVSPDPGGVKRAELFREALEAAVGKPVGKGFADK